MFAVQLPSEVWVAVFVYLPAGLLGTRIPAEPLTDPGVDVLISVVSAA